MRCSHTPGRVGFGLRAAWAAAASLGLAACQQTMPTQTLLAAPLGEAPKPVEVGYQALSHERFPVPAVQSGEIDPLYARQRVRYETKHPPGTVIVDPDAKFLYLVEAGGHAMRYGVGVGREGFGWSGTAVIARKAPWPTWTPPIEMMRREPRLKRFARGMAPSLANPPRSTCALPVPERSRRPLPHSWNQRSCQHRARRLKRLHSPHQSGCDRSLQARSSGLESRRAASRQARLSPWIGANSCE